MNREHIRLHGGKAERGMTIVELMIAMVIGLIVLGAVSSVFISTRQTFRTTDSLSRIQESARFALEMMARDIRMAGYIGCGNLNSIDVDMLATGSITNLLFDNAVETIDGVSSTATIGGVALIEDTDTISIIGAFDPAVVVANDGGIAGLNTFGNPREFRKNDIVIVSDCVQADVFRITNEPTSPKTDEGDHDLSVEVTLEHAVEATGNRSRDNRYEQGAQVFRPRQYTYFLGLNAANRPALFRGALAADFLTPVAPVELADNIENMSLVFRNAQGATVTGVAVGTDAVRVQIQLLLVSPEDNVLPEPQTYVFAGTEVSPTDRRMRQVFSTTVAIRNRLP